MHAGSRQTPEMTALRRRYLRFSTRHLHLPVAVPFLWTVSSWDASTLCDFLSKKEVKSLFLITCNFWISLRSRSAPWGINPVQIQSSDIHVRSPPSGHRPSISKIQPQKSMPGGWCHCSPENRAHGSGKRFWTDQYDCDTITLPYCKLTHQREIISGQKHSFKVYGKIGKKNVFILCEKQ